MHIDIRDVCTHDEYQAVQDIQHHAWGRSESIVVPSGVMITAQKNGGLVLGAFGAPTDENPTGLIGFVFGFIGLTATLAPKHCSHMTGVLPPYWNHNIAYRLKLAQRERVLAQGIGLITWTFDPLESRNAYLNISKLGAVSNTYLPNVYGAIDDSLNAGLPTDRLQVDWHIASKRVINRINNDTGGQFGVKPTLAELRTSGVPVIVIPRSTQADVPTPDDSVSSQYKEPHILIEIPDNFQTIKRESMELAHAWRIHIRQICTSAFAQGYCLTNVLRDGEHCYYLLEKDTV